MLQSYCPNITLDALLKGGGPTGVEFAAELHDLIASDIRRHFGPQLARMARITIYDVAPTILGSFDRSLAKYRLQDYEGMERKC